VNDGDSEGGGLKRGTRAGCAALDFDLPLEIGVDAAEDFDQGAFAGAVFTRKDMHFARFAFESDILQNCGVSKSLRNAGEAEQGRLICDVGIHSVNAAKGKGVAPLA
jgi:hypothetical protein